MTNETERKVVKRAARGMRAAALRLALERAGQESDPTLAYGCVDWFRYDAPAQSQELDIPAPPMAARRDARRDDASLRH
jgi:hypothetical protein